MPAGTVVVEIVSGASATMVMLNACVTDAGVESVACTVIGYVPAVVGVPLITPADDSVRVGGNGPLPPASAHVTGGLPPLDCRVVEG